MRKATNQPRCPVCNVASSATLVSRRDLKPAGEEMEKLVSCVRGLQEIVARPRPPSGADDADAAAAAEPPGDAPEAADEPSPPPPPPTAKAKPRAKSKAKPKAKDSKGKGKAKPRAKGRAARPAAEAPDAPAPEPAPAPRGRSRRAPAADLADYDENEALKRALLESAAEARTDRQRRRPGNDDGALAAAAAGANTELKRLQFNNPGRKQTVAAGFAAARVPGQEESGEQSQQDGDSQQETGEEAEHGDLGHQGPEQDHAQEDNHDAQHAEDDDEPERVQEFAVGEAVFALYPPEKKKFPATVRAWSAERAEYTVECEQPPLSAVVWQ